MVSTNISGVSSAWRTRPIQRYVYILIPIVLLATFATLYRQDLGRWTKDPSGLLHRLPPFHLSGSAPPDPLKLPGWRENITWVTSDPDVQLQHWLQRMSDKEDGQDMDWARNKTVLLLGDSVVRDWVWRLCDNHLHVKKQLVSLDEKVSNEKTQGWECVVPQTQTRLINGFLYGLLWLYFASASWLTLSGMTNYSRYPPKSPLISREWPPGPWGFEDRIPELVKQYAKYDPDMVVVSRSIHEMLGRWRITNGSGIAQFWTMGLQGQSYPVRHAVAM